MTLDNLNHKIKKTFSDESLGRADREERPFHLIYLPRYVVNERVLTENHLTSETSKEI